MAKLPAAPSCRRRQQAPNPHRHTAADYLLRHDHHDLIPILGLEAEAAQLQAAWQALAAAVAGTPRGQRTRA